MGTEIEVRHCRVLVAIDKMGGVAAAARELRIAQSTVSETLASFERVVGVPLTIRRSGREVILTPTGISLLPHARAFIAAADAALSAVSGQSAGVVRLGTVESVSSFLLPTPLRAFRRRWPRVDVQVAIGLCDNLRERVSRFDLDAAISLEGVQSVKPSPSGLTQLISPTSLTLVVSPNHPFAGTKLDAANLHSQTFLIADPDGVFNVIIRDWLLAANVAPQIRSAGSLEGVKQGLLDDDAIGVMPNFAVQAELKNYKLREVTAQIDLPKLGLFLTTSHPPPWLLPLQGLFDEIRTSALQASSS